jgi:hypothetical protein
MFDDFQNKTTKEIWEAKKLLYEGNHITKKTFIFQLLSLVTTNSIIFQIFLIILLIFTLAGTSDQWDCQIDQPRMNKLFNLLTNPVILMFYRESVRLHRSTKKRELSERFRPNKGFDFFYFRQQNKNKGKSSSRKTIINCKKIVCPWEIAISEIRTCFILLGIISLVIGLIAIKQEKP